MSAWGELIVSYALNTCWQLPAILLAAWAVVGVLRDVPARVAHTVWLLAAALAALLPASGIWGLFASASAAPQGQASGVSLRMWDQRLLLVVFIAPGLWRLGRLIAAAAGSWRWRRKAAPFRVVGIEAYLRACGVQLLTSPHGLEKAGPLLAGIFHPAILLPEYLTAPENRELLDAAIAHELAHVRRKDVLSLFLSELALVPLAFHPATVWLRRKLAESRELACDEDAARELASPVAYARSLLEVARRGIGSAGLLQTLGVADGGILERRIRALVERPRRAARRLGARQMATLGLAAVVLCIFLARQARTLYLWIAPAPVVPNVIVPPPPPPPPPPPANHA